MRLPLTTLLLLNPPLLPRLIFLLLTMILQLDLHIIMRFFLLMRDLSLLQKIILHPKCESIHYNRYNDDHDD